MCAVQQEEFHPGITADAAGIRALMRAILQDAILCLSGRAGRHGEQARLTAEALRWVKSRDRRWPFAFETICDVFGINPDYLRRRLLREVLHLSTDDGPPTGNPEIVRRVRTLRLRGNQTVRTLQNTRRRQRA
jgi:hypothetical protein